MESNHYIARIVAEDDNQNELLTAVRWKTLSFMGNGLPHIPRSLLQHIRHHLTEHYCDRCGEYIYNPFPNRRIRHFHYEKTARFRHLVKDRMIVHQRCHLAEWKRRFPRVLRLVLSQQELAFGRTKIRSRRMLAHRIWTIEEWNLFYPQYLIRNDGLQILDAKRSTLISNVLFTPDLVF